VSFRNGQSLTVEEDTRYAIRMHHLHRESVVVLLPSRFGMYKITHFVEELHTITGCNELDIKICKVFIICALQSYNSAR